jgi:hypothetical protein
MSHRSPAFISRPRPPLLRAVPAAFLLMLAGSAMASPPVSVRVGAFTGTDESLSRAVSETLLTDLAKSSRLTLLDRRDSREAGGGAAYTLTGSCLVYDEQVVINLRLVDGAGRSIPGAADNVEGPRDQVFSLVHSVAARLANRIPATSPAPSKNRIAGRPAPKSSLGPSTAAARLRQPVAPRIARTLPASSDRLALKQPSGEISETVSNATLVESAEGRFPAEESDVNYDPSSQYENRDRGYTSVIIDARGLGLERSMSPRIRRLDGSSVWTGGEASPDFVIEEGIVVYARSVEEARSFKRAGSRPLILEAADRYNQAFSSDPLLSEDDAEYLLKTARRDGFLKKFNVIFVVGR